MRDKFCWSTYSGEVFQGHVTPTARYLTCHWALSNHYLSCLRAHQNHCGLFFEWRTCPEPAIKTPLWHHRGKSCWHSYHMASVDAASEGMSTPTWPMVWQDPACRRVQATLIKSVPLQKHPSNVCKDGSSSHSEWRASGRQRRRARKTVCTEML